ncbi:MAG: sigma factor [Patulibacter minatonensis]
MSAAPVFEIDRLVRAAQRGDGRALEEVLRLLRAPMLRFAQRLAPSDGGHEDAVQEALHDVARGLGGYRWQASFLSWCYAICARRVARAATRGAREIAVLADRLEHLLATSGSEGELGEEVLAAQDLHLSCAMVIATGLSPALRRAYLLGDVLGAGDRVGGELCGCTPAAFRQRVSRARRAIANEIRGGLEAAGSAVADPAWPGELDRLIQLGALLRAAGHTADAAAIGRAADVAAPLLMGNLQPEVAA